MIDHEARKLALWSTEAAGALGLSARTTPAQLWAVKRGLMDPESGADNVSARLGLACQEGVARMHVEDSGDKLLPLADVALRRDVAGVPLGSHFDYWNATLKRLHEVKFFGIARRKEFGEPGSDTVPYDVLVQALHEMVVFNAESTGYPKAEGCEINVVFGNIERAVFFVPYDAEAIDKLLQREAEFWAKVTTGTPPEPTTPEDARRIWAKANGSEVIAQGQTLQAHAALMGIRRQLKLLEAQAEEMSLFVQRAMGEAAVLKSPDGSVLATWKNVDTERVDVKRLRAELPEVAKAYLNTSTSRRFLPKG